jgi:transcription initiation factor TFIIB
MDQVIDYGPECVSLEFEERATNTRASGYNSFSLHDFGLRTEIGLGSRDYSGRLIEQQVAEQVNSIRKLHSRMRVASAKQRRLFNVLTRINEICDISGLPKILAETAAMIYRNFESRSEAKGRSIVSMAAATIYLACKRCAVARSLDEIVRSTRGVIHNNKSDLKLAWRYYRMLVMELDSSFSEQSVTSEQLSCISSNHKSVSTSLPIPLNLNITNYIAKLANMAKIDTRIQKLAIEIAHSSNDHLLADGKSPNGLAAAYIYIAATLLELNLPQNELSKLTGVTEVTIRNRCKDILTSFKIIIKVKQVVPKVGR